MSASKQTTVVQAEQPKLADSTSPLIQTIATVAEGQVPTNVQLTSALESVKENVEVSRQEVPLSARGEILAKDASEIIDAAERLLAEKNRGDKLQNIVLHAQQVATEAKAEVLRTGAVMTTGGIFSPVGTMTTEAKEVVNYIRDLAFFAIRSSEFRAMLGDFIDLTQSIVSNTTDKLSRIGDAVQSDWRRSDVSASATRNETKSVIEEGKLEVNAKVNSTEWTEEQKRIYWDRFTALVNKMGSRQEYQRALANFWRLMDEIRLRADQVRRSAERVTECTAFDKLLDDAKSLMAEFTGKENMEAFWALNWDLMSRVTNDADFNAYYDDLKAFVNSAVNDPQSLRDSDKQEEGQKLLNRGSELMRTSKFDTDFNRILDLSRDMLLRIKEDSATNEFGARLQRFARDFALDAQGRPDLFVIQESLSQLRQLVIPILSQQLATVPIPRIEGSNGDYDFAIQDLTVHVQDFLPEYIELKTKTDMIVDVQRLETPKNELKVILNVNRFRPSFKNVRFWYKRNVFPKMEDYGIADIDMSAGEGTEIKIVWKIKSVEDKPFTFSLMKVKCIIDKMDIKIKDAKHDILDKIAASLFSGTIKQKVAQGIVDNIVGSLQPINTQMNNWFAQHPVDTFLENANKQMKDSFDKGMQQLPEAPFQKVIETGKEIATNIAQGISTQTNIMGQRAQQTYVTAKETIEVGKEVAEQGYEKIANYAAEHKEEIKEYVQDKSEKLSQFVQEKSEKAKEFVEDKTEKAKEFVQEKSEKAKEFVEDKTEKAKEFVDEKAEKLESKAQTTTTSSSSKRSVAPHTHRVPTSDSARFPSFVAAEEPAATTTTTSSSVPESKTEEVPLLPAPRENLDQFNAK